MQQLIRKVRTGRSENQSVAEFTESYTTALVATSELSAQLHTTRQLLVEANSALVEERKKVFLLTH